MKSITGRFAFSMMLVALTALTGCSDFRQAIGTEKSSPDEFEVVVRPPLSLPPDFTLRPNADNINQLAAAPRAVETAKLLLERDIASVEGYDALFGLDQIDPNIRAVVDEETAGIRFERRLPIQVLFGDLPDVGPILDQMAEDRRLRTNKLQERALNEGATPAVDGVTGDALTIQ